MDKTFGFQIKEAIGQLEGTNLQLFVAKLFHMKFGANFDQTRISKDKGCDGILDKKTIIAINGPKKIEKQVFENKVRDDYQKYLKYWKSNFPNWEFVCNKELSSENVKFLIDINKEVIIVDINKIMLLVESLCFGEQLQLARYLGINEKFYLINILDNVVSDMINSNRETNNFKRERKEPPYLLNKIRKNFLDKKDIDTITKEYFEHAESFGYLDKIFHNYSDEEISALKTNIITKYTSFEGSHKERIKKLENYYYKDGNDIYNHYVSVVIMYLFEICTIGERGDDEDVN